MGHFVGTQREADLVRYYNQELAARAGRELPAARVASRAAYLDLLRQEQRQSVLEIGSGAGRDGEEFVAQGFAYTGIDLAPDSVAACTAMGLDAHVASVLDLPFESGSFAAGWTMSTLLHVSNADLAEAMTEIVRVLQPGAPLAIGLWGDEQEREQDWDDDTGFGPPRFFSIRSDESLAGELQRFGRLEEAASWPSDGPLHYQWIVLRTPA